MPAYRPQKCAFRLVSRRTSSAKILVNTLEHFRGFIRRVVMNLSSFIKQDHRMKISVLALLVLAVMAGCKVRGGSNPALNFAPVPDVAPQNSYADVVSKAAPAVITIRADKRVRTPQQFPFSDD